MTDKLWMQDSYLKEWGAKIERVEQGKYVVLDKTAFYPEKGGQPSDFGRIICSGVEFKVVYGKDLGKDVSHEIEEPGLKEGDGVHCIIDWERRYRLMQMHTAAHLLHHVIFKESGALITGNQLGLEQSRMDFNVVDFNRELLTGFADKANELIGKELEISVSFLPREEAMKIPDILRLKDKLPKAIDIFRVVDIGGVDVTADGGTHVRNTGEMGKIKITGLKNKGANNRRVYFTLE
ncbi:MAG: alanyl-tRNA editing protein AlaX [Candidatus Diapherotrites archaeon]|uniref:Alanyl-tRNA editing protein AlaX n=1 Tax=Candidatus Iainarchaeum sp. TaxID=3101447 RepID=A0A2D6M161_9ARCH|nr:alanyl-tRNA editing protein AlaX [Candidatus Diapherotrites archaeon]|tara:strand:- start:1309 stop:2016 length:708 start_codon:yes stop_codon:yes gene_type:complete